MRGVLSAAEQRELDNAIKQMRLELESERLESVRLENQWRRLRLATEPQLIEARLRQINASIQNMLSAIDARMATIRLSAARAAWQQAKDIFGNVVKLVPSLRTKEGVPIPADKALHYSTRLWGAALQFASGNAARAHKELQNIANEWKRAGYMLPERVDPLQALLAQLGLGGLPPSTQPTPTPTPQQPSQAPRQPTPQTPQRQPTPKIAPQRRPTQQTPPRKTQIPQAPYKPDEEEIGDLGGVFPY